MGHAIRVYCSLLKSAKDGIAPVTKCSMCKGNVYSGQNVIKFNNEIICDKCKPEWLRRFEIVANTSMMNLPNMETFERYGI